MTVDDDVILVKQKGKQKAKNFWTADLCYIHLAYQS